MQNAHLTTAHTHTPNFHDTTNIMVSKSGAENYYCYKLKLRFERFQRKPKSSWLGLGDTCEPCYSPWNSFTLIARIAYNILSKMEPNGSEWDGITNTDAVPCHTKMTHIQPIYKKENRNTFQRNRRPEWETKGKFRSKFRNPVILRNKSTRNSAWIFLLLKLL